MTLIACNECEGKVSDKAAFCPHCGAPPDHFSSSQDCQEEQRPGRAVDAGKSLDSQINYRHCRGDGYNLGDEWMELSRSKMPLLQKISSVIVCFIILIWVMHEVGVIDYLSSYISGYRL